MSFVAHAGDVLPIIVAAFVVAAVIALVATPLVRRVVHRFDIVDHPDQRRVHRSPIPRGGGIGVAVAFLAVGGGLALLRDQVDAIPTSASITGTQLGGLFGGAALAVLIGALDDRFDLRARWQFLGQLAVALVAVAAGIVVPNIGDPFGPGKLQFPVLVGIAFTVVWIVGMINSLNFIDGLDGLSSGIGLIAAVTLGLLALTVQVDEPIVAVLCFALAGGLLGFLRWNFHPAAIFQGTSGVMFLGYTLGALSILGTAKVVVALLVLAVPIIDTFWVIVRRVSSGRSPFSPDRGHIHHRLLDLGLSHRATVLLIYLVCAVLGLMSLLVSSATSVLAFLGALVVFGAVAFTLRGQEPGAGVRAGDPEAGT